jgi:hypothetical protein
MTVKLRDISATIANRLTAARAGAASTGNTVPAGRSLDNTLTLAPLAVLLRRRPGLRGAGTTQRTRFM